MKTPLKVLITLLIIAIALVIIVFYRYDMLPGQKNTPNQTTSTQTTVTPPSENQTNQSNQTSAIPSASLANGKKLYEDKTCALCHGATGKADTPTGQAMKATDLTTGKFHSNTNNLEPTAYILQVIENGVPETTMVSFKAQIPNEKDRKDLADYVHSLSKN